MLFILTLVSETCCVQKPAENIPSPNRDVNPSRATIAVVASRPKAAFVCEAKPRVVIFERWERSPLCSTHFRRLGGMAETPEIAAILAADVVDSIGKADRPHFVANHVTQQA